MLAARLLVGLCLLALAKKRRAGSLTCEPWRAACACACKRLAKNRQLQLRLQLRLLLHRPLTAHRLQQAMQARGSERARSVLRVPAADEQARMPALVDLPSLHQPMVLRPQLHPSLRQLQHSALLFLWAGDREAQLSNTQLQLRRRPASAFRQRRVLLRTNQRQSADEVKRRVISKAILQAMSRLKCSVPIVMMMTTTPLMMTAWRTYRAPPRF